MSILDNDETLFNETLRVPLIQDYPWLLRAAVNYIVNPVYVAFGDSISSLNHKGVQDVYRLEDIPMTETITNSVGDTLQVAPIILSECFKMFALEFRLPIVLPAKYYYYIINKTHPVISDTRLKLPGDVLLDFSKILPEDNCTALKYRFDCLRNFACDESNHLLKTVYPHYNIIDAKKLSIF